MTKACDLCLKSIEEPFASVNMRDGEKEIMHFCSESCFCSGMSELIFAYLKEHGASKKSINTAVNVIYSILDQRLEKLQRRLNELDEDIATF